MCLFSFPHQKDEETKIPSQHHIHTNTSYGLCIICHQGRRGKEWSDGAEKGRSNTINLKTHHYYLEKEGGSSVLNGTFGLHIFIGILIISLWRNNLVLRLFVLQLLLRKVWWGPWRPHIISHLWGKSHNSPFSETFRWYSLLSPAHMKIFIHNCKHQ